MKYLIVGLGNIGIEYKNTRHNIGFDILDTVAENSKASFVTQRYGDIAINRIKGNQVVYLKPSTFMNLSGNAVRYWLQKENIPVENLLIITDDIALPLAKIRIRYKGSDAGHNGLKHIIETLGTQDFARLRFGIGNDYPKGFQIDYVLGKWLPDQHELVKPRLLICGEIIQSFVLLGVEKTMNLFNNK